MDNNLITDAKREGKGDHVRSFIDETGRAWALMSCSILGLSLVTRCTCGCVLGAGVTSFGAGAFADPSWKCALPKEPCTNRSVRVPEEISRACRDVADRRATDSARWRVQGGGSGLHIPDC